MGRANGDGEDSTRAELTARSDLEALECLWTINELAGQRQMHSMQNSQLKRKVQGQALHVRKHTLKCHFFEKSFYNLLPKPREMSSIIIALWQAIYRIFP